MEEKSKASRETRTALKRRTRRYRRRSVVGFYAGLLMMLLITAGGDYHSFRSALFIVCMLWTFWSDGRWSYMRRLVVSSLDDRAQVKHGVNFDQLSAEEQQTILRRYQMGRRVADADDYNDERQLALCARKRGRKHFSFFAWHCRGLWRHTGAFTGGCRMVR